MKNLSLVIILAAFGCGRKSSSDDSAAASVTPSLVGTWVSDCSSSNGNNRASVIFSASSYVLTSFVYESDCKTLDLIVELDRTYRTHDANEIDFIAVSAKITLKSQASLAAYNTNQYWGFSDWAIDVPKDVTGLSITPGGTMMDIAGHPTFNIFEVDGDVLMSGDLDNSDGKNGSSSALRPTEVSTANTFIKQ